MTVVLSVSFHPDKNLKGSEQRRPRNPACEGFPQNITIKRSPWIWPMEVPQGKQIEMSTNPVCRGSKGLLVVADNLLTERRSNKGLCIDWSWMKSHWWQKSGAGSIKRLDFSYLTSEGQSGLLACFIPMSLCSALLQSYLKSLGTTSGCNLV